MNSSFFRRRNRFGTDWSRRVRRLGAPGIVGNLAGELASKHWAGIDVKACAQERLAQLLNVSVRTISRWIAWLREHGWLKVQPAVDGQLALYTLTMPSNRTNQGATTGDPLYKRPTKTTRGDSPHPGQTLLGFRLARTRTFDLLPEPTPGRTTTGRPDPATLAAAASSGRPAGDG